MINLSLGVHCWFAGWRNSSDPTSVFNSLGCITKYGENNRTW